MSGKLSGKVALITGSSRGIGRATALAFAREGAAFIGVHYANNANAAQATVREIEALGTKAAALGADLKEGKAAVDSLWAQFSAAAVDATGEPGLDILVNNAGIGTMAPITEANETDFDETITVNLKAPFFLIQAAANAIRDNGRIINISTGFTRIAGPSHPAYSASKGALETLTLAIAPQFGARGITVNTVMPGYTDTDMAAPVMNDPDLRAMAEGASVFKRVGNPSDVADVVALVASPEGRWITGQVVDATGGARL